MLIATLVILIAVALMVATLTQEVHRMSDALTALTAQVAANTSAEASAVALIQGLAQQLRDAIAGGDTAALVELASDLKASADALGAAVVANTPAAPAAAV